MTLQSLNIEVLYFNNKQREDIWRALWRLCTSPLSYEHLFIITYVIIIIVRIIQNK
jgi:hypothetical protein